nr:hypothetical protein [uncultured Methanospirillum sp.]
MQNYDTLRISIQKRNDLAAEEHKIASINVKRAKLLKHQNDTTENTLTTTLKIHQINDPIDLNFIPIPPSSQAISIPSENVTLGHLKPIEQREHEPMEFQRIGELSTNIPLGYQNSGGSIFNKISERAKKP